MEKSLVQLEEQAGQGRYRLLETVRQYGRDRLLEAGEGPATRGRHLTFFREWVREASPKQGGEPGAYLEQLEEEHDNLRAALEWSLMAEEGWKEGLPLIVGQFNFWNTRNHFGEAVAFLRAFLEKGAEIPADQRYNALQHAGLLTERQADYTAAQALYEEARLLARQSGMEQDSPAVLQGLGAIALHRGEYERAAALFHEDLETRRALGQAGTSVFGWAAGLRGLVAYYLGDFALARSWYEESLAVFRATQHALGIPYALLDLGRVAVMEGEYVTARSLLEESLSIYRELQDKHGTVWALNSLAWISWHEGDTATARGLLTEATALCRETGRLWETTHTLVNVGHVARQQGDARRASRLFGAAEALREAIGEAMPPVERPEYSLSVTAARAALGEEAFSTAWQEGRAMTLDQAFRVALEESEIPTAGGDTRG